LREPFFASIARADVGQMKLNFLPFRMREIPNNSPNILSKVKFMSKNDVVFYECEKCKDENAIVCPHCNGEGENPDELGLPCDFCEGEGEIICPDCKDGHRG